MQINSRNTLALVAGLGLACGAAFANDQQPKPSAQQSGASAQHEEHTGHSPTKSAQSSKSSEGSMEIHKAMMKGMPQDMRMTGNTDQDFASMMIQHHRQAIAMSEAQLKHGKDPQVRRTAQRIIDESKADIAELEKWRKQSVASAPSREQSKESASRY